MTYGTEVGIPVKVEELGWRMAYPLLEKDNTEAIREEVDFLEDKMISTFLMSVIIN